MALCASPCPPAGGLVYVSDRVGEHDFSLLRRLVLPDGSGKAGGGGCRGGGEGKAGLHGTANSAPARAVRARPATLQSCRAPAVLRCRQPGRPTADCLFVDVSRDHQSVLKVRGQRAGCQAACMHCWLLERAQQLAACG